MKNVEESLLDPVGRGAYPVATGGGQAAAPGASAYDPHWSCPMREAMREALPLAWKASRNSLASR